MKRSINCLLILSMICFLSAQVVDFVYDYYPVPGEVGKMARLNPDNRSIKIISGVPAYKWSFGCLPTVGAMLIAYYDRNGYPGLWQPEPMQGASTITWNDVAPYTNGQWINEWAYAHNYDCSICPISASEQGLLGRQTKGNADDYYIQRGNSQNDPYFEHWTEHDYNTQYGRCVADYTGTSQKNNHSNIDGGTKGSLDFNGQAKSYSSLSIEGCHNNWGELGIAYYIQDAGYTVTSCYTKAKRGYSGQNQGNTYTVTQGGFQYSELKSEIDNNRPVILTLFRKDSQTGTHAVLAVGYYQDATHASVFFYDTSDFFVHEMQWNGEYKVGPNYYKIANGTVVHLAPPTALGDRIRFDYGNDVIDGDTFYPGYQCSFIDDSPTGNTIVSWSVLMYCYTTTGYQPDWGTYAGSDYGSVFQFEIYTAPALHNPNNYVRDIYGRVRCELFVTATDNFGNKYYCTKEVCVACPPENPVVDDITQVNDKMCFNLQNDGANLYYLYYDTDNNGNYDGTGALEGNSPVLFNSWDDIKLTGLSPNTTWHIAVKGVNQYGESSISPDYSFFIQDTPPIITQNIVWDGIVDISYPISISNNATLTIASNSVVNLTGNGRIICKADGNLQIESNVVILGENYTIQQDETNLIEIPGNRIEVYGGLLINPNVTFSSYDSGSWDGLYVYGENHVAVNQCSFSHCTFKTEGGSLDLINSTFVDTPINCYRTILSITNCPTLNSIYCWGSETVDIMNDTEQEFFIDGQDDGICLVNCGRINLTGYTISNNAGNGINISQCLDHNVIENCTIAYNGSDGIRFYQANAQVLDCTIVGNNKGVLAYRASNIDILKSNASNAYSTINNNTWQEILFTDDCAINMQDGMNRVTDFPVMYETFDEFFVQCPNMSHSRSFSLNYWGADQSGNPQMPSADRFYPNCINPDENQIGFILEPLWNPGIPPIITHVNDEYVYYTAIELALAENYDGAIGLFKQLISQYPQSEYAPMSAKNLMALEQDKQALKDYYHFEPNLHWNGDIGKLADYLENYCNIKMGDYQAAISWFENVIANPPSELDSLMAVIDLGYVYLLMQENTPKAAITCLYPQLKPKSRAEYQQNTDAILSALYTPNTSPDINNGGPITDVISSVPVLHDNYPNPFNPSTTISFSLPKAMNAEVAIYNLKGQKVKTLASGKQSTGRHSLVWDGTDETGKRVSSGIYFSKLVTAGQVITSKMVMLK